MIDLKNYVNEYENNIQINEGVWDSIKNWFKKLFSSDSSSKRWNRLYRYYSNDYYNSSTDKNKQKELSTEESEKLTQYLKSNYDDKNLQIERIDLKTFEQIVKANDDDPEESKYPGFYKLTDIKDELDRKRTMYFMFKYTDKNVEDVPALVVLQRKNYTTLIIKGLQIIKEFSNELKLNDIIHYIINNINTKLNIINDDEKYNKLIIYKDDDESLYSKLINDCKFDKKFDKKLNADFAEINLK